MEAEELRALLEAATREIHAISRSLPEDASAAGQAAAELAEARQALSEAAGLCAQASPSSEPACEDLRGALALRASAVRGCQEAEGELAALQQEHARWLQKLHLVEGRREQGHEQLQSSAKRLDEERAAAVESCKALEIEVQQLRENLSAKSRQLEDASKRGSALNASSRGLRKEQMRCEAQIRRAGEIFDLQESTERHIRVVSEQIDELDRRLVEEWKEDIARAEALQEEWVVQETIYREQESELEAMAVEVQESYEERWRVAERERVNRVGGQALLQDRAQRSCAEKLARLDAEQQGEVMASRRLVEQQREQLAEARATATAEMDERLCAKQQELQQQASAAQQRGTADRDRWLVRADQFKRQAAEHRGNIAQVSAIYRSRLPPTGGAAGGITPRGIPTPGGTPGESPRRRPPGGPLCPRG